MREWDLGDYFYAVLMLFVIVLLIFALIYVFFAMLPGFQEVAKGKSFFLSEFDQKNRAMQECLASEQYTRDECITLVGDKKWGVR